MVGEGKTIMTSANRGQLRAGAVKVDITPRDLAGLTNLWGRPFEGVHDPIFLRALVVDNGHKTVAFVAADLVEFGDTCEIRKRIEREVGIPAGQVIIAASHDHNAPRVGKVTPGALARAGGPATEKYTDKVYEQIVDVARQAKALLQPARVGIGTGTADVNTNRDVLTKEGWMLGVNPDGPSDKRVWVVKFETMSGKPLAFLMNYAVHSVVLGPENRLVTGDLAGAAERCVEQFYGDQVVALWTNGPAGDQDPKYMDRRKVITQGDMDDGYLMMESQGRIVGEEVLRVAGQIETMASDVRVESQAKVVSCPARIRSGDSWQDMMNVQHVDFLDLYLELILIDQIAIAAVSGEVVTNLFQLIKKGSPFMNTFMITLANDRIGYLVDEAAYDLPTFEARGTPLQRGCAESFVVNGLLDMMVHCPKD